MGSFIIPNPHKILLGWDGLDIENTQKKKVIKIFFKETCKREMILNTYMQTGTRY